MPYWKKEIEAWIKKAKSQLRMLKHFFGCKDVKLCMKYWIYIAVPYSSLLWGSKSWNISHANDTKLHSFHHSTIRRILGIWMDEVLECQITNKQVRKWFKNIPTINEFITRWTWIYLGKILRTKNNCLQKKMLGAWVLMVCKFRRPQSHLKENSIQALKSVLKENILDDAMFKEDWHPMAKIKRNGKQQLMPTSRAWAIRIKTSHTLSTDMICKKNMKIVTPPPHIHKHTENYEHTYHHTHLMQKKYVRTLDSEHQISI